MTLINGKNIAKYYESGDNNTPALIDASLEINEGEFVAIMGPSGSGKSTLLSILGVLHPPTSGQLVIDGINVFELSIERQADFRSEYLGFVFQQFQLLPYLTAKENVMLPLAITKKSRKEHSQLAEKILSKLGLGEKGHRLPHQLSGGEQGRVAIARAIVNEPPIILADEPTGSLDSRTGQEIIDVFKDLKKEGHTILMVTHNKDNVYYVDRTINIRDGRVTP